MTRRNSKGHRQAGERHGRMCALIVLEHLPGASAPVVERWMAYYREVVLRDAIAGRLAEGSSALACSAFAFGSINALAEDLNEAADLCRAIAETIAGAPT